MTIRLAHPADFAAIQAIEIEAGSLFAAIGMDAVADDDPFSKEELAAFTDAGHAWVAVDNDLLVGYIVVGIVDGRTHVEQVSVRPSHARRGFGRALVDHVVCWADDQGMADVTLTTFSDAPWNAPLYERLGFRRLRDDEVSAGLRRIRDDEAA
jgi:ribosomal protein S18 acetylase RimI-like enzyme